MAPYRPTGGHPPEPLSITQELRVGRMLDLADDERLMRVQVWVIDGERRALVDLIATVPADQFQSTFCPQSATGPIEVKVSILR